MFCSDRQGSRRGPLQTVPACRTSRVESPSAQEHPQTSSRLRERRSNVLGVDKKRARGRRTGCHYNNRVSFVKVTIERSADPVRSAMPFTKESYCRVFPIRQIPGLVGQRTLRNRSLFDREGLDYVLTRPQGLWKCFTRGRGARGVPMSRLQPLRGDSCKVS